MGVVVNRKCTHLTYVYGVRPAAQVTIATEMYDKLPYLQTYGRATTTTSKNKKIKRTLLEVLY